MLIPPFHKCFRVRLLLFGFAPPTVTIFKIIHKPQNGRLKNFLQSNILYQGNICPDYFRLKMVLTILGFIRMLPEMEV